ncbi:hypothetical protein PWG71_13880 [Nocardiopsis sp. N85]|uniref:hypothetical protein n=1 Tax=Nocardiopsis sp. N85 TaxID=3029400 RepID=UPI00237F2092|nr:hypothetical protein [Nocardiopsis sp. N85]MDE3722479.1 hypothetical protein [Nocardiopsis sp. N85]
MEIQTRRLLDRAYADAVILWQRMVFQEFKKPRGLLNGEDCTRNALHLSTAISWHINGRTNLSQVGITRISQDLGFSGNGHNLYGQLDILLESGVLTQRGKKGRAPRLALSVPCVLVDELAGTKNDGFRALTDSLALEIVDVVDLGDAPLRRALATHQVGEGREEPEADRDVCTHEEGCICWGCTMAEESTV